MTLGSLFDGIGGFPLVAEWCGIETLWTSDIEPSACRISKRHFPNAVQLGDVKNIDGSKIQPVDIIAFGFPCQDLSVAGKRAGLKHEAHGDEQTTRSGLFYEAVRIIKEMRSATDGRNPTFAVFENVPGLFTADGGDAFREVIEQLCRIKEPNAHIDGQEKWKHAGLILGDGYSFGFREFNAADWGVPQRRKRIYAVLDLAGHRAGQILFEREGLRRDIVKSEPPWERFAKCSEDGIEPNDQPG